MKTSLALFLAAVLAASPALALDLQSARSQGLVREMGNGYIASAKPSAEVDALVASVNAGRKAEYERIAKEKGSTVEAVGAIAAQEIAKKK